MLALDEETNCQAIEQDESMSLGFLKPELFTQNCLSQPWQQNNLLNF